MSSLENRKIVVGVDGSAASRNALRWATAFAERDGAEVSAVMAWNYPAALMIPLVGAPLVPADHMAESARTKLDQVVAGTPTATAIGEQWVVMGAPRAVLTEATQDHDLLVVGRTGNRQFRRAWLGSTAAHCVRHGECPVAIIGESIEPEKVVTVAVDGSTPSIEALVWAIGLGDDHEILAVYSHDEWELDDLPLEAEMRTELDAKADEMLAQAVAAAVAQTGVDDARIRRQVRQGDPRTTIVDQADPDELLVLGAQGHSGLARWMLGSLADYAAIHAPGSVVIWR